MAVQSHHHPGQDETGLPGHSLLTATKVSPEAGAGSGSEHALRRLALLLPLPLPLQLLLLLPSNHDQHLIQEKPVK